MGVWTVGAVICSELSQKGSVFGNLFFFFFNGRKIYHGLYRKTCHHISIGNELQQKVSSRPHII